MSTAVTPMYEWNALPWKRFERQVFKLQQRIYRASRRGDRKAVHRLQRLLMTSWAARCLAVRKVTQDNRGKRTAGVDGVSALTPRQRLALARSLRLSATVLPTRRVWIPKPGSTEQRPLGIPTMGNRAEQALAKLALEPEWEARFEPNSYGFRPGRSCHDAIEAIWTSINKQAKYVLDADIAKCFDRIDHQALLTKLHTFPVMRRAVRAWLKAGVMDGATLFPTTEGTPQGGVASPLLANIALHGLEEAIRAPFPHGNGKVKPLVVRYADDFVVLHYDLAVIEEAQRIASAWLGGMGLAMKPSKTRVAHTLEAHGDQRGFDFLGFTVRQFPVGKTHSGKRGGRGEPTLLGFKTIITPSKDARRRHTRTLGEVIRRHKASPQATLILRLNPVIRGWTNYYATVCAKESFAKLNQATCRKLRSWARFRHPGKSRHWVARKYWHPERGRWDFAAPDGPRLLLHDSTPIRRHTKVKGARSPYDGDWVYWGTRLGRHPELAGAVAMLLRRQHGKCAWCAQYFRHGDALIEADHTIPKALGGGDWLANRQLLHGHCHDEKTARDGSLADRGPHDRSPRVEEPDAGKLARPVLQAGRPGDRPA